jgi:hypothetical protein
MRTDSSTLWAESRLFGLGLHQSGFFEALFEACPAEQEDG